MCTRERGSVAITLGMSILLLFSAAAFAVDLGNSWQTKRRLHTATDAGALAATQQFALGNDGCESTAKNYVLDNDSSARNVECKTGGGAAPGSRSGYVSVSAESPVQYFFAGAVGIGGDDPHVHSSTTAAYGSPHGVTGLRPMGLCIDANAALTAWLNAPAGPTGPSGTIRIPYTKAQPSACGSNAPGNWGMLDFNGGPNSNEETKAWIRNGYPGEVTISPPTIDGDTGAFSSSIDSDLATLLNTEFNLPVWDSVAGTGSNAGFHLVAFVHVKLIDYKANGSQSDRYLDLQFLKSIVTGSCCGSGPDTGARAVAVCAVEANFDPSRCQS